MADLDIGTLMGGIEFEDTFSSVFDKATQAVTAFAGTHDELVKGVEEGWHKTTEAVKGYAEDFTSKLKEFAESPVQSLEGLAKEVGENLVKGFQQLGPEIGIAAGAVAGLGAAVVGVAATTFEFAKSAAEAGEKVNNFSLVTGIAHENVGALDFVAKSAGGSLDQVQNVLRMIEMHAKAAEDPTSKFSKALGDININSDTFIHMDSESKLLALAKGFEEGSKSGNNLGDALAILGRSGANQLDFITKFNPEMMALAETMGTVWTKETAAQAEKFTLDLGMVETALGSIGVRIGQAVMPQVEALLTQFINSPTSFNTLLSGIETLAHGLGYLVEGAGLLVVGFIQLGQAVINLATMPLMAEEAFDKFFLSLFENLKRVPGMADYATGQIAQLHKIMATDQATIDSRTKSYDALGKISDGVYNTTEQLAGALKDVHLAGQDAHATDLALNTKTKELGDTTKETKGKTLDFTAAVEAQNKEIDRIVKGPLGPNGLSEAQHQVWVESVNLHDIVPKVTEKNKALLSSYEDLVPTMKDNYAGIKDMDEKLDHFEGLVGKFSNSKIIGETGNLLPVLKDNEKAVDAITAAHKRLVDTITADTVTLIDSLRGGWDGFKTATIRVFDDIVTHFEEKFVKSMISKLLDGVTGDGGLSSVFGLFGTSAKTTLDEVGSHSEGIVSKMGFQWTNFMAGVGISAGIALAAWGIPKIISAFTAPGQVAAKTPLEQAQDAFDYVGPGGQSFLDIMAQHPELWGQGNGFAGGTHGQYLDFGRGTPVMLHGKERVMTESEGRSGYMLPITVQVGPDVLARVVTRAYVNAGV